MNSQQILSLSVTPVVLISACGLITLALYNRLGVIFARIRAFHQQKIELLKGGCPQSSVNQHQLLNLVDFQVAKVTAKAKMVQNGLICLLAGCLAFLACSLFAAVSAFHQNLGWAALGSHIIGLSLFAAGLSWAVREMVHSLKPLEEESAYLKSLAAHSFATTSDDAEQFTKAA